ncbi:hypothetical protein HMI01_05190 [Halolactibacillus miurensis]|uniref:Uncharacterized protein YlaI n=1 Tax=Halolactibacillus miurensis TaxID=306541 RepID=A0A1I6R5S4_9BACI|nr:MULTISPECIES: YlaI family protein [Halolactibacillus]GEM03531.1 hypothetical protein HMI01_05190 [Halolactibacillus miurensis]SFS60004.1 Uncharacterized protein YlaI [Halolactibacillus miurensis]
MDVMCPICDTVESINNDSPLAKKLRNRRKHLYLCQTCHDRIEKNTLKRQATGRFNLYEEKKEEDPYLS